MSRIGSTPGPDPYRPVHGVQGPASAVNPAGVSAAGAASGPGAPPPLSVGEYAKVSEQIRAGIAQGMTKDEVLRDLVQRTTRERFGRGADPQMAASIGRAFETDPHLKSLFKELYQRAAAS